MAGDKWQQTRRKGWTRYVSGIRYTVCFRQRRWYYCRHTGGELTDAKGKPIPHERLARPSARIVQLRDWHFVPRDLYALDARQVYGRDLTEEGIEALHEEHLLQVELVQLEQAALLRCLAQYHGLRRLLAEGMTEKDVPLYPDRIGSLREADQQLAEVRGLMKGMAGREETEFY